MRKHIKFGQDLFTIDFNGYENGYAYISVYSGFWYSKEHKLKMHYRQERTWDDHLGNTESGYYVNIKFPYGYGTHRVYCLF